MKRSEMNDYIYEEIKEALEKRQYSNETDEKYWKRKSGQLLDMLLGFGMLPPERKEIDSDGEEFYQEIITNEWENENEC